MANAIPHSDPSDSYTANVAPSYRPPQKPPDHIGAFRILETVGEGGMGIVYKAEQREPVRRIVALKVIKLGMDTKEVVARFEAERQALAMLSHPNVARVFEAGMTENGRPFFAMEFVAGVPFTQYCDESRLTTRQRLELFIPVCQAIHHSHQKGIIHRDLKPTNILVTLADGKPVPKVIDFGIAKATNQALAQHTLFTQTGTLIGTPEYMSPEQAGTSGLDVDTRTDIYSLGAILYEVLTGTLPLDPKSLRAAGLEGMARLIKNSEPQRPSTRLLTLASAETLNPTSTPIRNTRALQKELRGDLDWVVLKALEKDRSRRYETVNALAMDVQRHLDNELVLARPPSTAYRIQKFVRKHRAGVLTAATAVFALVLGLMLATFGYVRARADRSMADKARIEAQEQKKIADDNAGRADENARQADQNARRAERETAEGLILQADALSLATRFPEAQTLYAAAYDKFVAMKEPLTEAELGLWNSYSQTSRHLLNYTGHTGRVNCVAMLPNGRHALSGGADRTLKLWDLVSGRELRTFIGHAGAITSISVSPDGRMAISASDDKTLKLWDVASGQVLRSLTGHTASVRCVSMSWDGKTALSCGDDKTLRLWDLASGKELRNFTGTTVAEVIVVYSPDGRSALSAGNSTSVKVWNLASGKPTRILSGHTQRVLAVAITPDGHSALSGSSDGKLILWDLEKGREQAELTGHTKAITSIFVSTDGMTALTGSADKTLRLWDLKRSELLCAFTGHTERVTGVAIAADGKHAISGSFDGTLKLWGLVKKDEPGTFTGHSRQVASVAVSPDGRTVLSASADLTIKLWDAATAQEIWTSPKEPNPIYGVAFAPDGRTALSAGNDKTLKLWDLDSGKVLRTLVGHAGRVMDVAVLPDSRTALSASTDKTLKLWDLASGKEIRTFAGHLSAVEKVAISPDGKTAISGADDRTLKVWDLASGQEIHTLLGHDQPVISVAFAPDGKTALSSSLDGTLKQWDLHSGQEFRTFTGATYAVTSVAISSNGRTAISGGPEGKTTLWDLKSGKELGTFSGHNDRVRSIAVAPDGQRMFSGSNDYNVKIWDFGRGMAQWTFEPRVAAAQAVLKKSPNDPAALATLGEWFAFRGDDEWAAEYLTRARDGGGVVLPLTLARCYWNLDQHAEARREFQVAIENSHDPAERNYLNWCIRSIDTEPERQRAREAAKAAEEVVANSYRLLVKGITEAWLGKDANYAATSQQFLKSAEGIEHAATIERAAKLYCLRPSSDAVLLDLALKLAKRAVDLGRDDGYLPWYRLALGMAEYRRGPSAAVEEALALPAATDDPLIQGPAWLFSAMNMFRLGKQDEARRLFGLAEAKMKPIPSRSRPLQTAELPDDVAYWLVYEEAKSLMNPPPPK